MEHEIAMGLFYNLGLAHQLAGLCCEADSQRHLQQAQCYYKKSLSLFGFLPSESSFQQHCHSWFSFVLGLLNNLAHLHCHFWEMDQARSCSDFIKAMLCSPNAPVLAQEHEMFFSINVFCNDQNIFTLAPCA